MGTPIEMDALVCDVLAPIGRAAAVIEEKELGRAPRSAELELFMAIASLWTVDLGESEMAIGFRP